MFNQSSPLFSLDNFEGPLELLLYLIQKEELDICDIVIKRVTEQLIGSLDINIEIDLYSDLLALISSLLLLKSQKLVPKDQVPLEEGEEDPRVEMIQHLIEYCRFKEAAKVLSQKEDEQKAHFQRASVAFRKEVGTGLEEVGIEDLKRLLQNVLQKANRADPKILIRDEEWQVSSKIAWFRELNQPILLSAVFHEKRDRRELIVLFLALLELMKLQEFKVVREKEGIYILRYESRA